MNINKSQIGEKTIFSLSGRLDTATSPELQEALIPEFDVSKEIELDFSQLAYISSAGLRVLLMGEKTAKSKGSSMTVTGVSPEIMEVFDMTGFSGVLKIV